MSEAHSEEPRERGSSYRDFQRAPFVLGPAPALVEPLAGAVLRPLVVGAAPIVPFVPELSVVAAGEPDVAEPVVPCVDFAPVVVS